ncbi:MAG: OmpA family protein [Gammaproteobacteria bacterium]
MLSNSWIKAAVISLALCLSASTVAQDALKQTLFEEAKDALIVANRAQSSILAPSSYLAGAEHYKRAEETLNKGGSIDRIRTELAKAVTEWEKAHQATKIAQTVLSSAIRAREDAKSSDAENYALEAWTEGEKLFQEAAITLEKGSQKNAMRQGLKAEAVFREAELGAIKANYLNETNQLLDRAKKLKAKRYAPGTFDQASSLFLKAEKELTENRYDTDRPRSLAQDAKHKANLAIYLAENLKRVERDRPALEAFVIDWQTPVKQIGAALDIPVYFDNGYNEPTGQLVTRITELLDTNRIQAQDLAERKATIRDMESQITALETRLGGASKERLALAAQLDQQARIKAKFAAVEQMFTRDQAIVLRSGNNIILRLVGLTFESGEAEITPDKYPLLRQVEQAINQFTESMVEVEGHTDAFGSDESNLELSADRALAVKTYMMASMGMVESQIKAIGHGEAQPIANNETPEGRLKNRRIDIIILPTL